ncbi:hypothetical protein [Nocardia jinanensis]
MGGTLLTPVLHSGAQSLHSGAQSLHSGAQSLRNRGGPRR